MSFVHGLPAHTEAGFFCLLRFCGRNDLPDVRRVERRPPLPSDPPAPLCGLLEIGRRDQDQPSRQINKSQYVGLEAPRRRK